MAESLFGPLGLSGRRVLVESWALLRTKKILNACLTTSVTHLHIFHTFYIQDVTRCIYVEGVINLEAHKFSKKLTF